MIGHEWDDLFAMLNDVHGHRKTTGQEIELFDDPMRLRLGYKTPERFWQIRLTNVRRCLFPMHNGEPTERQKLVQEYIKTAEGRHRLANEVVL